MRSLTWLIVCTVYLFVGTLVKAATDKELEAWNEYKRNYNKTYEQAAEEELRLTIFLENKRYIESHNVKATGHSFEQGLNPLSDLTPEEVVATRCGFRMVNSDEYDFNQATNSRNVSPTGSVMETILTAFNASQWLDKEHEQEHLSSGMGNDRAWYESLLTQSALDYRERGVVSKVKDQGACGSCWAFATTGALESILAMRGRQVLLSEQNLVDCSRRYGNNGCQGGLMNAALRYVRDRGIMSNKDYPYVAQNNKCRARPDQVVMRVRGHMVLPRGNEALLRVALALSGPIPVAIDAGARSFHSYKSGVYNDDVCRNSQGALNHAVLLVGYGTSPTGGDYWILKNSWGKSWGDNGYIRMARNKRNMCGVASFAVLPIP